MFSFDCNGEVSLSFKNEIISITCIPEYPGALDDDGNGFDSAPSNGEFSFFSLII